MTNIGTEDHSMEKTQRIYARVAGFLFLWLIILGIAGLVITSRVIGSGPFAQTAKRVVASEHLYRAALSCGVVEAVSAALLPYSPSRFMQHSGPSMSFWPGWQCIGG